MALGPVVEEALASVKQQIAAESAQVKAKIDALQAKIDELSQQVGQGLSAEEVVAALSDLKVEVSGILPE